MLAVAGSLPAHAPNNLFTAVLVVLRHHCLLLGPPCLFIFGGIVGNMLGRLLAISCVTAMVLLSILLQTTAPATIGPLGILIVFILMYVSVLGVLTFLLFGISRMVAKLSGSVGLKRPVETLTLNRSYYFASVIALAPVMFIGMQSVGDVGFYDVSLVVLFVVIACVYIAKRTS